MWFTPPKNPRLIKLIADARNNLNATNYTDEKFKPLIDEAVKEAHKDFSDKSWDFPHHMTLSVAELAPNHPYCVMRFYNLNNYVFLRYSVYYYNGEPFLEKYWPAIKDKKK